VITPSQPNIATGQKHISTNVRDAEWHGRRTNNEDSLTKVGWVPNTAGVQVAIQNCSRGINKFRARAIQVIFPVSLTWRSATVESFLRSSSSKCFISARPRVADTSSNRQYG
jgi:hypothetical protein